MSPIIVLKNHTLNKPQFTFFKKSVFARIRNYLFCFLQIQFIKIFIRQPQVQKNLKKKKLLNIRIIKAITKILCTQEGGELKYKQVREYFQKLIKIMIFDLKLVKINKVYFCTENILT